MTHTIRARRPGALGRLAGHAAVLAIALFGTGGGCPFDTRDPVPPDTNDIPEECRFSSATLPIDVLRNLETAFGCETDGVDMLRQSLSATFVFEAPDEGPSVQDFFAEWDDLVEPREGAIDQFRQHMATLTETQAALLILDAEDGDEVSAEEGFVFEDVGYALDFLDGSTEFAHFEGEADIYVRLEGANYVAYRWVDFDQGFPSMARFWFEGTTAGESE